MSHDLALKIDDIRRLFHLDDAAKVTIEGDRAVIDVDIEWLLRPMVAHYQVGPIDTWGTP
jgi:hypothetical protein